MIKQICKVHVPIDEEFKIFFIKYQNANEFLYIRYIINRVAGVLNDVTYRNTDCVDVVVSSSYIRRQVRTILRN